ncbi:MAG: YncE family protein [Acidimicrobiia bacterium]
MARRAAEGFVAVAVVIALAGVAAVAAVPPTAAGKHGPATGRLYRSGRGTDPSIRLLAVGNRPDGRPLVVMAATFECEELELEGSVLATVRRDGSFRAESDGFALTGGGTDEVDAEVTVRGRFRGTRAEGSIEGDAEAYDNAGTTGTCDDTVDWTAKAGSADPDLQRIRGTVSLTSGPAVVAAAADAAYVATAPDDVDEARLHRIDAATHAVTWEIETGVEFSALAATADAVWAVDGTRNRVLRFDAASGEEVASIPLDAAVDEPSSFTASIAATDTAVWVAVDDLFRIDPAGNSLVAALELENQGGDALLAADASAAYVALNQARGDEDTEGPPHRLLRVDPNANSVVAEVGGVGHFTALAAGDDALWAAPFLDPLRVLDPTTLAETGTVDVEAAALAAAPPGAWVLTERAVAAYDPADAGDSTTRIPLLGGDFGSIAASGDAVCVWDPRLGTLTRIAAG